MMSLTHYKEKRDLKTSPEPSGGKPTEKVLRFVVQKHQASHLHYDFRLELRGVLKSWAVPKGLSLDPSVKRLAMLVEDHPWDYRNFEGVIPSGYGAGTVIVWDEGTFKTNEIKEVDKETQEHSIASQFWKGKIELILTGKKLKGKFIIARSKDNRENAWYITKVKDKYATAADITKKDKSVLSNKTLEQVSANPAAEWKSHKPAKGKNESKVDSTSHDSRTIGIKKNIPAKPGPMTCTLLREPFTADAWLYELKIDGYRILAHKSKDAIKLLTRSGLDYARQYPIIIEELIKIDGDFVMDGEIAVLDAKGRPYFDALQKYKSGDAIVFFAFDLLWQDGYDITNATLLERKSILERLIPSNSIIRYTEHFDDGIALFEQVKKLELEGIVAKRKDSVYVGGKRSKDWLKIPTEIREEFVVGGWAESDSGRSFKSLIFGAYDKGQLRYIGHAGGGYKEAEMPALLAKLKKLEINKSPFINEIDTKSKVHFVKPILVGNFKFATFTAQGKIRKPAIFLGLREDKDPKDVEQSIVISNSKEAVDANVNEQTQTHEAEKVNTSKKSITLAAASNWRELDKQKITTHDEIELDGKKIELTNIEKILWPEFTKGNLITYYHNVAPYILPHLHGRPLSLHIKHLKPTAPGMYIKDMEGRQPKWASIFSTQRKHKKEGKRSTIDYLLCQDEATLLYVANLGCIDVNPWTSRISNYQEPDFIIIDLDPSDNDFTKVIKTALAGKKIFDKLKLKVFPKTSGRTGMHLYIPCRGFTFPQARAVAVNICEQIKDLVPLIATTENSISERGDKLFVDYNQNDEADTVAAPYSVRPAPTPTVSTPLDWKEVKAGLRPDNFTVHNILARLNKKGDLFKLVLDEKIAISNSKILSKL